MKESLKEWARKREEIVHDEKRKGEKWESGEGGMMQTKEKSK